MVQPLVPRAVLVGGQTVQEDGGRPLDQERAEVLGAEKPLFDGVLEEPEERLPIVGNVEQAERLAVQSELAPGKQLKQLIERSGAAGKGDDPSDSSAMNALRSCIVSTMCSFVRPTCAISCLTSWLGITPITVPPAASAPSASAPIRPTLAPP